MHTAGEIAIESITNTSPRYQEVWDLREAILRKPLGRSLKDDDLSRDYVDTILIALHAEKVIGCLILHHYDQQQLQLRAMAVYNEWQGRGVGRLLVQAAEKIAEERKYKKIILHARKVALGFYQCMGYTISGDEFTEVGIPHHMMEKAVTG